MKRSIDQRHRDMDEKPELYELLDRQNAKQTSRMMRPSEAVERNARLRRDDTGLFWAKAVDEHSS